MGANVVSDGGFGAPKGLRINFRQLDRCPYFLGYVSMSCHLYSGILVTFAFLGSKLLAVHSKFTSNWGVGFVVVPGNSCFLFLIFFFLFFV